MTAAMRQSQVGRDESDRSLPASIPWSELEGLHGKIGRHFARSEPRARALSYLHGLLTPLDRKNGRRIARLAEESRPDGMQRLLTRAQWSADAVRDELQDYVKVQV